jgi:predicted amidohydrolase YtcJ
MVWCSRALLALGQIPSVPERAHRPESTWLEAEPTCSFPPLCDGRDHAPLDPVMGIYAATTRRTLDGRNPNGWIPEQRITVAQAVHAYTIGSAFAEHQETVKGSIEPGKLADLVVLSDDIFTIQPEAIENTRVDMTIFDGKVIYQR